ncbi:MAG: UDP-N-acetylglucosamine 2-epimerase, partial [Clostridia bacterium]
GPVVLPLHPRTRDRIARFGLTSALSGVTVIEPQGYRASLTLIGSAAAVLTDSGGVQREGAVLGVPVYVLRDETEWVELVQDARAVLVGADADRIEAAVREGRARPRPKTIQDSPSANVVADLTG